MISSFCFALNYSIDLLEKLQHDEFIPDIELREFQYRLLASQLTPKNGVRTFGINALSKELKNIYKEPIQKLVKEIFASVYNEMDKNAYSGSLAILG